MSDSLIPKETLAFDFLKLLDPANQFSEVYSVVVYYSGHFNEETILERHIQAKKIALGIIEEKGLTLDNRESYFYIILV